MSRNHPATVTSAGGRSQLIKMKRGDQKAITAARQVYNGLIAEAFELQEQYDKLPVSQLYARQRAALQAKIVALRVEAQQVDGAIHELVVPELPEARPIKRHKISLSALKNAS